MSTVLYDNPGPKAKARNVVYAVVFVAVVAAVIWWLIGELDRQNQLDWERWSPYTTALPWTDFLIPGLIMTLQVAALSMIIALPFGAVLGIARLSDRAWTRGPATVIVEFFRAIPVLVLMIAFFTFFAQIGVESELRKLLAAVLGLVLYNSSVIAEIVRAGVLSLPKGQSEAGMAVGLRKGQLMNNILLPQAVTAMLPAIVSQLVVIVKDTAIAGAVISLDELIGQARPLNTITGAPSVLATLTVIALIFIAVNFALTSFASWLEKWLRTRKKSTGAVLGGDNVGGAAPGMRMEDVEIKARAPRATGHDAGGL